MSKQIYGIKQPNIESIMNDIKSGKYIIPVYQREFVWSGTKIIDLLDSVVNGYPIGALTDVQIVNNSLLANGRNEIFEALTQNKDLIDKAIVDGQQRLTSLAIVYFATEMKELVKNFKSINQSKAVKKAINDIFFYKGNFYTLNKIQKLFEDSYITESVDEYSIINKEVNMLIRQRINAYTLPIIRLTTNEDSEVINVFTAMNKGGKPLTHVELMNGSMFNISKDYDLIWEIKRINNDIDDFGKIKNELFVQLMKLFYDISEFDYINYKKDELINFSMQEKSVKKFIRKKDLFEKLLHEAIGILKSEFGIYTIELMPKNVYIIAALAYTTLKEVENNVSIKILKESIARISYRLIMGHYASNPGLKAMEDINNFMIKRSKGKSLDQESLEIFEKTKDKQSIKEIIISKLNNLTYKNKAQGLSKLAISIMYRNNPLYILDNKSVPIISSVGIKIKNDLHHFIPKGSKMSKEYNLTNPQADFNIDKLANISVITSDENRNAIRSKDINVYLNESQNILGQEKFKKMIDSHMFDQKIIFELMNWNYNNYNHMQLQDLISKLLNERIERISEEIINVYF